MTLLLLLACTAGDAPVADAPLGEPLVPLSPPLLARRLSLDLRGVLPTVAELDQVEADPAALATLRDAYLEDARLEGRLVDLYAERFQTRLDTFEVEYYDYHLDASEEFAFERAVGEEPLRLMAHVAVTDAPWSDIVTADYTMANELLGRIWPLDYPDGATGWQEAHYTDARPAAGILATNGLWWRYVTNISNQNRSRAAAISRLLLCEDILSRPVSFAGAISLADTDGTASAIKENPGCVACHATVEPLAASMFGFWVASSYTPLEHDTYPAEREAMGPELLGVEPAFFGQPVEGLVDLGGVIASDSRFWRCAAQTAAEGLWRREATLDDFDRIDGLRRALLDGGLTYRPLLRAVTDTPTYQAGGFSDAATDADRERELTLRMLTAEQLGSAVADLTGFAWSWEGYDQLSNDDYGYRVLSGGVDGYSVGRPQARPGLTWALVVERLAQGAAAYAVEQELTNGGTRRLFGAVTLDDRPGSEAFDAELAALSWRLTARRPDDARLAEAAELWSAVEAQDGAAQAWTTLVSVMIRDPEFVGY